MPGGPRLEPAAHDVNLLGGVRAALQVLGWVGRAAQAGQVTTDCKNLSCVVCPASKISANCERCLQVLLRHRVSACMPYKELSALTLTTTCFSCSMARWKAAQAGGEAG